MTYLKSCEAIIPSIHLHKYIHRNPGADVIMDNYELVFFRQAAPLLVVHSADKSEAIDSLNNAFSQYNLGSCVWDNSILKNRLLSLKFIVKFYGDDRIYKDYKTEGEGHLILSPFNPKSDLFPNGILSQNWFSKYFDRYPFAVIHIVEELKLSNESLRHMKESYTNGRIRFILVIVGKAIDEQRLTTIRQETNIPKSDMYKLDDSANTLKLSETLIATIASTIKSSASSFYSDIQHRIKQRHKKYYTLTEATDIDTHVTLTPKFLETRNLIKEAIINEFISPHNLEPALPTFETAYQNLIELLEETFPANSLEKLSDHDRKLMLQIQNLIDTVAFHIVRGYLSSEKPVVALKKHMAHIVNVTEAVGANRPQWLSIQYEWLAELISVVPASVLGDDSQQAKQKKIKNKVPTIPFFGGFQFFDGDFYDVYSHPGLIFMKAASLLKDVEHGVHRTELLESASECFKRLPESEKSQAHRGFRQYLNWELARAHEKLSHSEKSEKALTHYESCFSYATLGLCWPQLGSFLVGNLLAEYESRDRLTKLVTTAIRASKMTPAPVVNHKVKELQLKDIQIEMDDNLIDVKALCFKDQNSRTISVSELFGTQVSILSLVNLKILASYLGVSDPLQLTLDSLTISYEKIDGQGKGNMKNVILKHDASVDNHRNPIIPDLEDANDILQGATDLSFKPNVSEPKIIQLFQSCHRAGTYVVSSVSASMTIHNDQGSVAIVKDDFIGVRAKDTTQELWHHAWVYTKSEDSFANRFPLRLHNDPPYIARVNPLKPNVIVSTIHTDITSLVVGERASIPFQISHKLLGENAVDYGKVLLTAKVDIIGAIDGEKNLITPQVNWDGLKDDEALPLDKLISGNAPEDHKLNITLHNRPSTQSLDTKSYMVNITMQTWVRDEYSSSTEESDMGDLAVYDTALFSYSVIDAPFQCRFSVFPAYREEGVSDMPCPFVILDGDGAQPQSMPVVSRFWKGALRLLPIEDAFKGELPEIVSTTFNIRTKNLEVSIELVDEVLRDGESIVQLFSSRIKSGSHRNVLVNSTVSIEWRRPGQQDRTNIFESDEWEIALPLSDPRVLLDVKQLDSDEVRLKYIIENPTPRVFTFTTLLAPEETSDGTVWDFSDDRNSSPLDQPAFPVLPFNRHVIEYYAKSSGLEAVDLPRMKVYDVHFKVFLPALPVTSNARVANKNLRWFKKQST